ncbi:hypothetical protein BJL95_11510 [Methylomonas sp. LWB]|uniref:efflux RND transporter periplasmic adaptor subunit n=1 Tax=Methylomonas sp. LWB TaxID=1905845 RepID=UPI0008DA3ABD|nr:efflux RND transporter periplasmic adaptor subunit [Methylomonas sp. LWB]OHX36383.1 hypothetical protein BJL95_11510 [Methylomonas sp. LWB]
MGKILLVSTLIAATGLGYANWPGGVGWTKGPSYKTAVVSKGDVTLSVAANGALSPRRVFTVGAKVSGTVRELCVDYNSRVEAGQVLLILDDALSRAQVAHSAAALVGAEAELARAKVDENRVRALAVQAFASVAELDQAVQTRRAAAAGVERAHAQLQKDRVDLADTVIRAPADGIVLDRFVEIGQTVAAKFQTPTLLTIAEDLTKMRIDANFAESEIGAVKPGQSVSFSVDAFPEREFTGEVAQIRLNPSVDQNVVTYDVVIWVDNPERILFPGMTAYVNVTLQESRAAVLVPNAALRFRPDAGSAVPARRPEKSADSASRVYVLDSAGQLRAVEVKTGITDNRNSEVLAGALQAGDTVVTGKVGEPDGYAGASQRRAVKVGS